jgi:lipoyl-dependent peroxiredoxin
MAIRKANAVWNGGLQDGNGTMKLGSGAFEGQYSFASRFEEGTGTNPEELLGAALAGCFSMALAAGLGRAGFAAKRVATEARVQILKGDAGLAITRIELDCQAEVPGVDAATFAQQAEGTKANCIISKALSADIQVVLSAKLV